MGIACPLSSLDVNAVHERWNKEPYPIGICGIRCLGHRSRPEIKKFDG